MDNIKWIFSGIGILILTNLINYLKTKSYVLSQSVQILKRDELEKHIGNAIKRIRNAKTNISVLGIDCKFVAESSSVEIENALKRNIKVKILIVDPDSAAADMIPSIDPRFYDKDFFVKSAKSVVSVLIELKRKYPTLFEYKFLPILPSFGIFITDSSDADGIVKIEPYVAKEYMPTNSRPHLIIKKKNKEWRDFFINQWDNYWNLGIEK